MRAVAILVLVAGVFGCNSEATVCPQPGLCDNGAQDSGSDADVAAEAPASEIAADADAE